MTETSYRSVQFSRSVMSDSLRPHGLSMPGVPVYHQLLELAQTHAIESVMPSSHLIICHPLLLLPSVFPNIRVFSKESDQYWLGPRAEGWSAKKCEEYSEGDGNILYFNCSDGFTGVYNCQNSWNCTLSCTHTQKEILKLFQSLIRKN